MSNKVYTFSYNYGDGNEYLSVFDSLDAVITRLKMMQVWNNFDADESIKIECQDVLDNDEMELRLQRTVAHKAKHSGVEWLLH